MDVAPSESPLEQEPVSLRCSADNYTYEHLRWYRLDPRALQEEQVKYAHAAGLDCRSMHQYARALDGRLSFLEASNSWLLDFSVPAVRPQDEGHYVCEAQSRRNADKQCLFRYVSVRGERWRGWKVWGGAVGVGGGNYSEQEQHRRSDSCTLTQ